MSDTGCKLDEGTIVIDTSVLIYGDMTDWINAIGRVKAYYPPFNCSSFLLEVSAEEKKNIRFTVTATNLITYSFPSIPVLLA